MFVDKIIVPDGVTGAGPLAKYDPAMDSPQAKIAGNNVALLKLSKRIVIDSSMNLFLKNGRLTIFKN